MKVPSMVGLAWYHGRPCKEYPEFAQQLEELRGFHNLLERVQVSHAQMRDIILETGIAPQKVHLIPIGINLRYFSMSTEISKAQVRERYGIPQGAIVIGSFQKDGVGWGEGRTPKLIKGPDIFIAVLDRLKEKYPELHVLLTGPSRGYMKKRLLEIGVPFTHVYVSDYENVGEFYQALDLYLITSRQEGGPKAMLECMASGVPLVTTRVGQAMDIVKQGENAWMADVEDIEALVHWARHVIDRRNSLETELQKGRKTAEQHTYESQVPLWRKFFSGIVHL